MNGRNLWRLLAAPAAAAAALFLAASAQAAGPKQQAKQILEDTQVAGGLIVHLGCGDPALIAALRANPGYLVHALDRDLEAVEKARQEIRALGVYGPVAVDTLRGNRLPYLDNLVNLVVSEDPGGVSAGELMRVLRPGGVAYVKTADGWKKTVKPWPPDIDEWTHFLHGPDNNAVAHDSRVGDPRHLHWLGEPKFARAHEQLASMSACVTTAGRLFYIVDEAPRSDVRYPSEWFLVARDAFNGVVLWKRPISTWANQLRRFRSGPAETAFRLAAQRDRVYVTLGFDAPVSILDAVTGRTLATCQGTDHARQILRIGDKLVVLVDTRPQAAEEADSQIRRGLAPAAGSRAIVAADAADGKTLWRSRIDDFVHPTLCAEGDRLLYQTNREVVCLSLQSGKPLWHAEAELQLAGHELGWEAPTLVVDSRAVYCADFKKLVAFSLHDGSPLWQGASQSGYNSPPDVFLVGGLVWTRGKGMTGLDPATGQLKQEIATVPGYMHHRCYRDKATDRFFLLGIQGVQVVDRLSGDAAPHHWLRGTCQYGIMPANGLLYVTPNSCACNMKSKLPGFWALAAEEKGDGNTANGEGVSGRQDARLERGPAYNEEGSGNRGQGTAIATLTPQPSTLNPQPVTPSRRTQPAGLVSSPLAPHPSPLASSDWPVYRHDFARSGLTKAAVPAALAPCWSAKIGGRLSGVTVADGKLFVASVDEDTIYALDERSGATLWSFTAGGRVDSPPTIYRGMALFGSADGWVYALGDGDGELIWRFRAAPEERRTFVNGQLESVWPVHGSVLVHQGKLIVAAGRSSYLDGGIRISCLDPVGGRLLAQTVIYSPDPATGKQPQDEDVKDVRGLLTDILVADGPDVYMRQAKLDLETGSETGRGMHLFCPVGLLDDTWWHRAYWVFHDEFIAHWSGWWKVGNYVPSGRILSYDETSIVGYGRDKYPGGNTGQWREGERYRLFACDRPSPEQKPQTAAAAPAAKQTRRKGKKAKLPEPVAKPNRWQRQVPFYVRAMVVAGDTMFIAGPPEVLKPVGTGEDALLLKNPEEALAAWQGARGGRLWAVSAKDGSELARYELGSPPVFDGMAVAAGRLYLATMDGNVLCYGK